MRRRSSLFGAGAALVASLSQAQPPVRGIVTIPAGDPQATGGAWTRAACQPTYPDAALKAGAEGVTRLTLTVGASGRVEAATVLDSAGPTPLHKLLDQAGIQAAKDCAMFTPRIDARGQAVRYPANMEWRWLLHPPPIQEPRPALLHIAPACRPRYPPAAVRAGAQGDSVLRITVDAQGHAKSVEIVRSAGESPQHKLLDQAAAQALPRCPYTPGADLDGNPVGTQVLVNYTWRLAK